MENVDWLPPVATLVIGLAGGAFAAWRVYRSGQQNAPAAAVVQRDLAAKSEALLQQLRELEDAAAKRDPDQLARERYALELEAARALRALDEAKPAAEKAARAAEAPATVLQAAPAGGNSALRGFLWGTGTMAALGLLLFSLTRSTQERREGGQLTGNLPGEDTSAPAARQEDAELARLQDAVTQKPDDIEARLMLARAHLSRRDMMAVWNETKAVLERSPGEPRALSYQALVRLAMGQGDLAAKMINDALAAHPDYLEGYLHLAIVYMRTGKAKEAEASVQRALKRFPAEREELEKIWKEIQQAAPLAADGAPTGEDPHANLAPPASGGPATSAAAPGAATGKSVQGTIDVDPSLKGKLGGGILFVMLRPEAFGAGPPLAAKRITVTSFPITFEIGAADSMNGEDLPDRVLVQARLDSDGNPTTRDPSDPVAQLDRVQTGTRGITLTLAPRKP